MKKKRKTAGQLQNQVAQDTTKYDAREIGDALKDDIGIHLRQSIELHKEVIAEEEFCVVMVIATDPLLSNLIRRKFYCWPYLPKPRPNQSVFLYNRSKDDIVKRLWVLPSAMVMAELSTLACVHKKYHTMQAWSIAYFEGIRLEDPSIFWDYIRHDQKINLPSEHEYFLEHREELIKAGCKPLTANLAQPFDFSKISVNKIIDPQITTFN